MSNKCFGIALFGFGRAGNFHFYNIRNTPRAELLYIVDEDTAKAERVVQEYRLSGVKVLLPEDSSVALQDSRVNAVVVASPTFTHQAIVMQSIAHGKAVLCEKPIASSYEETKLCYEAAAEKGVILQCSFNRRYDPSISQVKEGLSSGAVGKLHLVKICSRDHCDSWQLSYISTSGGMLPDMAIHDLDLACWLVGQWPCRVHVCGHAHDAAIGALGDVDTAVVTLKFPDGTIAVVDLSRHATYAYDQRIEVFGEAGMLQSQNQKSTGLVAFDRSGVHCDSLMTTCTQRYDQSYARALDNFLDIVQGSKEQDVSRAVGMNVSKLVVVCEESLKTGKSIEAQESHWCK